VSTREEFLAAPAVVAAIEEYGNAALDHIEAGGLDVDLPDLAAFFQERGIPEPPGGPLTVTRTVRPYFGPQRHTCPDGSDPVRNCFEIGGKTVCGNYYCP
jgi:hypothetical protein